MHIDTTKFFPEGGGEVLTMHEYSVLKRNIISVYFIRSDEVYYNLLPL